MANTAKYGPELANLTIPEACSILASFYPTFERQTEMIFTTAFEDLYQEYPIAAEARLRPIIRAWVTGLIDGGSTPDETCEIVAQDVPLLYKALGRDHVLKLCQEVHRSEDLVQSDSYTLLFSRFNKRYFNGALPEYRVRVVLDVLFWITEQAELQKNLELAGQHINLTGNLEPYYYLADDPQPTRVDLIGRQIILAVMMPMDRHVLKCQLLHHMARVATGTIIDDNIAWREEMKRLSDLGAPVNENGLVQERSWKLTR